MKFENYKILIFLILPFLSVSCGGSNPYMKGEIKFISKNNTPCLYIDDDDFKGQYLVLINDYQNPGLTFSYLNNFIDRYPDQKSCVVINSKNFEGILLKKSTVYNVLMEIELSDGYGYKRGRFCIKDDKGNVLVQESIAGKCPNV
ncbi:hypothetical protein [Acinetobacter sp. MB5]|uniref:hypothetical protein n=1 Tax=Acinetobacter sp. MB5 TaxID=2069438 RepID=UPI000DCFD625|nr:hypothetical protein [Acinetobacter sp. MB5]